MYVYICVSERIPFLKINVKGKPQKKVLLLMAGLLRGWGGKGRAIKEKITFFNVYAYFVAKFQRPLSLGRGW